MEYKSLKFNNEVINVLFKPDEVGYWTHYLNTFYDLWCKKDKSAYSQTPFSRQFVNERNDILLDLIKLKKDLQLVGLDWICILIADTIDDIDTQIKIQSTL